MTEAFLSIGSNIERRRNVRAAVDLLAETFGPLRLSRVYRCPAVGFEGNDFYNLAVAFDTELSAPALEERLKALEYQLGRRRSQIKYSDRPIDIDLVIYGDTAAKIGSVTLPRKDVLRRAFILRPLADIAPQFVHPLEQRTLGELWEEMAAGEHGDLVPVEL